MTRQKPWPLRHSERKSVPGMGIAQVDEPYNGENNNSVSNSTYENTKQNSPPAQL